MHVYVCFRENKFTYIYILLFTFFIQVVDCDVRGTTFNVWDPFYTCVPLFIFICVTFF